MKSSERKQKIKSRVVDQKINAKFLKTTVNIIFVMAKRNFISGKLNIGTHISTLSVNIYVCSFVFML